MPGIALIILGILHILFFAFYTFVGAGGFLGSRKGNDDELDLACFLCISAYFCFSQVPIMIGAWNLFQLRSVNVARFGCVMACIPFVSPLIILGLPFGVWGLIVMMTDSVEQEMD